MKTKIMIVDDHPIIRHGMMQFINQQPDTQICCQAGNPAEALNVLRNCQHQLAIVDVSLEGESGFGLIQTLAQDYPALPILVMSMHDEAIYAERALRLGAKGYIMKSQAMEHILTAIRRIAEGGVYVSDEMQKLILGRIANHCAEPLALAGLSSLTEREFEILRLIGMGYATKQIAQSLQRSVKTIDTHRCNIKEKLGIKSGTALLRFAAFWMMERE